MEHSDISSTLLGAAITLLALAVTLAALIPTLLNLRPSVAGQAVDRRLIEDAAASFVKQLRVVVVLCGVAVVASVVGLFWPNSVSVGVGAVLVTTATFVLVALTLSLYSAVFGSRRGKH